MEHLTTSEIEAKLSQVRRAPADAGTVEMIVARPTPGERTVLEDGVLDSEVGLVGDCWEARGSRHTPDGAANPLMQLTLMSARAVALFAGTRDRWPLAGDQLYVDFDLSRGNLPPGTRLAVGEAVVEITDAPHTGCAKFVERFGVDAARFVNTGVGLELRLRGVNARVITGGSVRTADEVRVLAAG